METQTIRDEVRQRSPSERAIWPNGLGFDWRGWEYSYGTQGWHAFRSQRTGKDDAMHGIGQTPAEAKQNARPF